MCAGAAMRKLVLAWPQGSRERSIVNRLKKKTHIVVAEEDGIYTQVGCCQEVNGCRNGESHPSRSGYCLIASCANIFPLPATNCHGNIRHALTYNAELSAVGSSAGNTRKCDCATGVYCNMQGNSHGLRQQAPLSRVGCPAVYLAGVAAVTPCFPLSA
jgi:hypothetical protein